MSIPTSRPWIWGTAVVVGFVFMSLHPGTVDAAPRLNFNPSTTEAESRAAVQPRKETYLDTRFTIAVHAGFVWGGNVDYDDRSSGIEDGSVTIDSGASIGGQLGFKVAQNAWVIASYHHQFTSGSSTWYYLGVRDSETADLGVGYLQIGGQIEFPVNDHLVPLMGLTIGASYFAASGEDIDKTDWFFALAFFGGLKIPVVKHFGFLTQLKLLTTVVANESRAVCAAYNGCILYLDAGAMVQGEISGGVYVAF